MLKVIVKNLQGEQTHGGQFTTLQEAQDWIQTVQSFNGWGTLEQTVITPAVIGVSGEIISPEIIETIPATYTVDIVDVTAEIEAETLKQKALLAQAIGSEIIAKVWTINETKTLTQAEFLAIIADEDLARIERLLKSGSLKTAKALIQAYQGTAFSASEKTEILNIIEQRLLEL